MEPEVGQIWTDNYDYNTGYVRYARIVDITQEKIVIRTVGGSQRLSRVKRENFTKAYTFDPEKNT